MLQDTMIGIYNGPLYSYNNSKINAHGDGAMAILSVQADPWGNEPGFQPTFYFNGQTIGLEAAY